MKRMLVPFGAKVVAPCVFLTAMALWIFPALKGYAHVVFLMFFGLVNISISPSISMYRSLIFPRLLPFGFLISILNPLLFGAASMFLIVKTLLNPSIVFSEMPFWLFVATITILSVFWHIAASKLTPNPGTMAVDKDGLYYLAGDVLPRLSYLTQVITPETKIPLKVLSAVNDVDISVSFCFAPWVFEREARQKLYGSMNFNTLLQGAEKEYHFYYSDVKKLQDIWKVFDFSPMQEKQGGAYVWNNDPVVAGRGVL